MDNTFKAKPLPNIRREMDLWSKGWDARFAGKPIPFGDSCEDARKGWDDADQWLKEYG